MRLRRDNVICYRCVERPRHSWIPGVRRESRGLTTIRRSCHVADLHSSKTSSTRTFEVRSPYGRYSVLTPGTMPPRGRGRPRRTTNNTNNEYEIASRTRVFFRLLLTARTWCFTGRARRHTVIFNNIITCRTVFTRNNRAHLTFHSSRRIEPVHLIVDKIKDF